MTPHPPLPPGPRCPMCWRNDGTHALGCAVDQYVVDLRDWMKLVEAQGVDLVTMGNR